MRARRIEYVSQQYDGKDHHQPDQEVHALARGKADARQRDRCRPALSGATASLYPVASDFLRAVALTLMSWAWSRLDETGGARMASGSVAFARWVWPELGMRHSMVSEAAP
jgi:hypothetical protein